MSKNHDGPDGPRWPDGPVGPEGPDGQRKDEHDVMDEHDVDEDVLRQLLCAAVNDMEPSPGALEHLRRAVPARRARKRQALIGAVAAVLLLGTAVPAVVHVAQSSGVAVDNPANAGHSESTQEGDANGAQSGGQGGTQEGEPSGKASKGGQQGGKDGGKDGGSQEPGGSLAGGAAPSETMAATSPNCTRDQLTGATSSGTRDGTNTVYGVFRVSNTSETACTVDGGGQVVALAPGGTDSSAFTVVNHTAGDPASGLPDPAGQQQVILQPGAAYEVKFAWIPAQEGTGGCQTAGPSPDPGSSGEPGDTQVASSETTAAEPTDLPGSVELSHTPQAGEPVAARVTITNVCAGTIYRTGALTAS